jgi:hypothetical protein
MVAGFMSERWPASNRNTRPASVGICTYLTLLDFLTPKSDFVADLGQRLGSIISDKQGDDAVGGRLTALDAQQEAVERLIEMSHPTTLAGVAAQVLLAIRNLLDIGAIANERTGEDLVSYIERTREMLEAAAPLLADIAGVDLDADYGAFYGTACCSRQKCRVSDDAGSRAAAIGESDGALLARAA